MWRLARHEPLGPQPEYHVAYYTRNVVRDFTWLKENWRADHRDPLLLTRPRSRSLVEYLRPLLLRESWDHFDVRDLRVTLRQLKTILRDDLGGALVRVMRSRRLERRMRARYERVINRLSTGEMPVSRILFVCYGNICRSPYAERYARLTISKIEPHSAGFHAVADRESPAHLIRAASNLNVHLEGWRSRKIDAEIVANADLILTMDAQNFLMMEQQFPQARHRTVPLALFDGAAASEIEDPYALSDERALEILTKIGRSINGLGQVLRSAGQSRD
jgi:protein-tyrosine-phosphatase